MIKVYNKSTNYLRIDGKILAPFGSKDFDFRSSQIRVLERNGSVTVSEILSNNTKPQTELTSNPEVKEEVVETVSEVTEEVIEEPKTEVEEEVPEELKEVEEEKQEETEIKEVVEVKKATKKSAKKPANKKKGGNK